MKNEESADGISVTVGGFLFTSQTTLCDDTAKTNAFRNLKKLFLQKTEKKRAILRKTEISDFHDEILLNLTEKIPKNC